MKSGKIIPPGGDWKGAETIARLLSLPPPFLGVRVLGYFWPLGLRLPTRTRTGEPSRLENLLRRAHSICCVI